MEPEWVLGGSVTSRATPAQVDGSQTDWAAVSADGNHACARITTGRLYCWGWDGFGQLGVGGTNTDQPAPVQVAGNRTDWAAITTGSSHTCARSTDRRLYCWGTDDNGQLGNGSTATDDQTTPVEVDGNRTDWATVTAGSSHTCARSTDRWPPLLLGQRRLRADGSRRHHHQPTRPCRSGPLIRRVSSGHPEPGTARG